MAGVQYRRALYNAAFAPRYGAGCMELRQLLELLVYTVFLLVLMPLLLLWAGRFAKYCSEHRPGWIGFPAEKLDDA